MTRRKKGDELETIRTALDYFNAGVPALGYFEMQVEDLAMLVKSSKDDELSKLNSAAEVCLIGLAAYFEAFCKAHFAARINICPEIIRNFVDRRQSATVKIRHLVGTRDQIAMKLGNLISEEFNFGSAREINGLYQDLVRVSPFSVKDAKQYDRFLSDRNLLVHHGGVYTYTYASQRLAQRVAPGLVHWDSLVEGKKEFARWASFILAMAKKIATTSRTALEEFATREKLRFRVEQKRAIRMLT